MTENRIHSLDFVRIIAMGMILTCHYLIFSGVSSGLGRYFAGTGNMIFFLISALLYGNKYNTDNDPVENETQFDLVKFIKKRIVKIGSSLYPFLFILFLSFVFCGVKFSWFDAGLNIVFLGYFGKLPGNGHLWFITVLMACYIEMAVLVKIRPENKYFPWLFLTGMVLLMFLGEWLGVPSQAFIHMGFFGFMFLKNQWFNKKFQEIKGWQALLIVLFNVICMILNLNGLFEISRPLHFLLSDLCGLSLLALALRYLPKYNNKVVTFLSGISFEIYLIHHTFCAGPIIRITSLTGIHVFNYLVLVLLSVLLSVILHYTAQWFTKIMDRLLGEHVC